MGEGGVAEETRQNEKSVVVLFVGVEGIGGLNVADVRRERIPLLWSTVRERGLAKGFSFNMGDAKCLCVCRRPKWSGRGVHSETVREVGRGESEKL